MFTLFPIRVRQLLNSFNVSLKIGETSISLTDIIQTIVTLAIFTFCCRVLKTFLKTKLLTRFGMDEGNREAISTLVSYGVGTFGFIIVLQASGLKLDSLAVVLGGLGVGIGFGLQNTAKDFISGFTLLIERKIKVGDFIELDGLSGHIKEVALRSTLIRTTDGGDVVVPNGNFIANNILNWTVDSYVGRIKVPVRVAYGSDPLLVTEVLMNVAYEESSTIADPPPKVMFLGFGEYGLEFELWVWVNRIEQAAMIRSSLNFNIDYHFRMSGLKITFRQYEVLGDNAPDLLHSNPMKEESEPPINGAAIQVSPAQMMSLRELLKQVTYFADFSELQLRQLIEVGFRRKLKTSEVLFRENDPGDAFYIVLSGAVEVFAEKLEKQLAILPAGKFFGELSLMLGIPRTASVRSLEDTTLFVINRTGFQKLLQENGEVYESLVRQLEKCQSELAERREELSRLGLIDRDEKEANAIVWMRKRLKSLFSLA